MWYRHRHSDLATETTGKQTLVHYLRILVHGMPSKYSKPSFPSFQLKFKFGLFNGLVLESSVDLKVPKLEHFVDELKSCSKNAKF